MNKCLYPACLLALLLCASCGGHQTAQQFLAWSMEQHQALKSYSSTAKWKMSGGLVTGKESEETRLVSYQSPNLYQVVSKNAGGLTLTSISDGAKQLDLGSDRKTAMLTDAPKAIQDAGTLQMLHPMYCGSLLYKFFAGASSLGDLVDESKGGVSDGGEEPLQGGGKGRVVKFFATGMYGNTSALIDEKTGMVQRITYDCSTLMDGMKKLGMATGNSPISTTETYSSIQTNPVIRAETFKASAPNGIKVLTPSDILAANSPLPIGEAAPDFTLSRVDGTKVKLSSLRGKPVMIDFWETWCVPCRDSLPHTEELATQHKGDISVIAISDENAKTITAFQKENHFTFPAFMDPDHLANKLYKVDGFPTFVVIDSKGLVVAYIEGVSESELNSALEKVGIKVEA
jgi:peroxiredoxin/outer membrane lipoprotein-sorting protein